MQRCHPRTHTGSNTSTALQTAGLRWKLFTRPLFRLVVTDSSVAILIRSSLFTRSYSSLEEKEDDVRCDGNEGFRPLPLMVHVAKFLLAHSPRDLRGFVVLPTSFQVVVQVVWRLNIFGSVDVALPRRTSDVSFGRYGAGSARPKSTGLAPRVGRWRSFGQKGVIMLESTESIRIGGLHHR